jgi:hypothetical protein
MRSACPSLSPRCITSLRLPTTHISGPVASHSVTQ